MYMTINRMKIHRDVDAMAVRTFLFSKPMKRVRKFDGVLYAAAAAIASAILITTTWTCWSAALFRIYAIDYAVANDRVCEVKRACRERFDKRGAGLGVDGELLVDVGGDWLGVVEADGGGETCF